LQDVQHAPAEIPQRYDESSPSCSGIVVSTTFTRIARRPASHLTAREKDKSTP